MPRRLALLLSFTALACASKPASDDAGQTEASSSAESDPSTSAGTELGESESDGETTTTQPGETETETETGTDTGLTECPDVPTVQASGLIVLPEIDEASGMVRSRTQDVLWVHNDSGDSARLFALRSDGLPIAEVQLAGAGAIDWEDLALGPGPAPGDYLYAGDIGDNAEARPGITIYRVPEPADVARIDADPIIVNDWDALALTYPDSPHNAETLLVDPVSGDLFIVTKGDQTKLYRLAAPLASGELEALADPNYPSAVTTAGDISPLGDFIMVRGYADAFAWLRAPGQTVGEALLGEPCEIPLASEQQGETLAIDSDGAGYFTLSEGTGQTLWAYRFAD